MIPKANLCYCLTLFLYSILSSPTYAQHSKIDSLQLIIDNTSDALTRIENTNFLALELLESKPEEALALLQQVYPEAATQGHPVLADISHTIGRAYHTNNQLDSALVAYESAFSQAQQLNNWAIAVRSLSNQAYVYDQKNLLDTGLIYAKRAHQLAIEKNVGKEPRCFAANALGRTYSFRSEFDSASIYLHQVVDIMQEMGEDKRLIAEMYVNIGNNEYRAQNIEKARAQHNEALRIMQEIKDPQGVTTVYRAIGAIHYFEGEFPEAISNFHQAVDALEGTDYYGEMVTSLDFLGETYLTIEDYSNALRYWQEAIDTWQLAYADESNADLLFKKGRVYFLQENYQEALETLMTAKDMDEANGKHINGELYWHIGKAMEMLGNLEEAAVNYQLAIEHAPYENIEYTSSKSLIGLAQVHEKNNLRAKALSYFQEAYELAAANTLKESEMLAAAGLYRLYKQNSNSTSALKYLEINKNIQDSLYNEENTQAITRMQANFEFEQEKQELVYSQEQELKEQTNLRRFLWGALAITGLLLFVSLLYFRSKQKANEELSRLNKKILQQKNQLEELDQAKSRFFTNISHEFRTPLTIIKGMNEQIRQQPEMNLDKGTLMIRRNTHSLLNLINQILDLRKLEANELKLQLIQSDIIEYVHFLVESHKSLAEHNEIQLHFESEPSTLVMDYDPEKVLRIVSNLLSNAIKFTPNGGNIYVHIKQVPIEGKSKFSLQIKDTGIGIAEENLAYIFDRFYQEDNAPTRSGEGTGIGLALSRELVKLMGDKSVRPASWRKVVLSRSFFQLLMRLLLPLGSRRAMNRLLFPKLKMR